VTTMSTTTANEAATHSAKDNRRVWIWWFLVVLAASQLYFVRELLAAFALFAIAFVAIAIVVAGLYTLTKAWEFAVIRLAELRHPVLNMAQVAHVATATREDRKAA
jgi:cytochrome c-type biogenesis protein CcmH/NrfG